MILLWCPDGSLIGVESEASDALVAITTSGAFCLHVS